jgi:conjugal transfer ATP-binding protein TraC
MLDRIREWGEKTANWVGEALSMGEVPPDADVNRFQASFDYASLSHILHYETYDPDTKIFYNQKSQGFVLEATALTGAGEEAANILYSILIDVLPKNADLQILLWGSDKVGHVLDNFENKRTGFGKIYEWIAKKRTDFLKKGVHQSLLSNSIFLLRDFRLFFSVSLSIKKDQDFSKELVKLRDELSSSLQSINIQTRYMDASSLKAFVNNILHCSTSVYSQNKKWNPYDSLSSQLIDPEYSMRVYKKYLSIENEDEKYDIRALSVNEYPESAALWEMEDAIGQLYNTSLQIPCPFLISFSLRKKSSELSSLLTTANAINTEQSAKSKQSTLNRLLPKKLRELQYIQDRLDQGDQLVHSHYQIILFCKQTEGDYAERKVRDLYRSNRWELKKNTYLQLQSLLAALPMRMSDGMYEDMKLFGRMKTITAFNAANIAPLLGEWSGTPTPMLLLIGRRGQLTPYSPFDNLTGNYNLAIAAPSGKGKTALAQDYIFGLLGSGNKVWVIDIGHSYEKFCKIVDGTFIEFTPEIDICINPFTHIHNFDEALELLKPLLAAMVRPSSRVTDEENVYIEKSIKEAWFAKGNQATITTIASWLDAEDSPICKNLSLLLYSYTQAGMYGRYFEGESNIDLSNQFVVLELQDLNNKKDLRRIVMMVLMFQINQVMYLGERTIKKTLILDEFWQHFDGQVDGMSDFINTFARTVRRFTGSLVPISQSVDDYFKNATTLAVYNNSDNKIVLQHSEEAIDELEKNNRFGLNPMSNKLFKSLRKTEQFSECLIKSPSGLAVLRIVYDPFSLILFSSKGDEYDAVKQLELQGHSMRDAVEIVARKKS